MLADLKDLHALLQKYGGQNKVKENSHSSKSVKE